MKRTMFALAAVSASLLAGFFLAEVVFRLEELHRDRYRSTAVDTRTAASTSMRNPWSTRSSKNPGLMRVAVIGDSFTWGSGVHADDAYPSRLARLVRIERHHRDIEVLNFGERGNNTVQSEKFLASHVLQFQPDLVLYGFCLNDPEPTEHAERDEMTRPLLRRTPTSRFGSALRRMSATARFVGDRLENTRQRRAITAYYNRLYDKDTQWFKQCRHALREMKQMTSERGIPFVVIIFPVFDSHMGKSYPYAAHHKTIEDVLSKLGIRCLDLLPAYEGMDGARLAVTPFTDPHPNEIAHRIAADAIYAYLRDEGLLPAPHGPAPGAGSEEQGPTTTRGGRKRDRKSA